MGAWPCLCPLPSGPLPAAQKLLQNKRNKDLLESYDVREQAAVDYMQASKHASWSPALLNLEKWAPAHFELRVGSLAYRAFHETATSLCPCSTSGRQSEQRGHRRPVVAPTSVGWAWSSAAGRPSAA